MPDINGFYKPELTLFSNGTPIPYNKLKLYSSAVGILLKIDFSINPLLDQDDLITGQLSWKKGASEPLFTSCIEDVYPSGGMTFQLLGREGYYRKLTAPLTPVSWRKSNLKEILQDLFEITNLRDFDISSCADISLSRFSIPSGDTGFQVLSALLMMIRLSSGSSYCYRPSPEGTLIFGPVDQIHHKTSDSISFETGVNILTREAGRIRAFALPVLFNQIIEVNGEDHLCSRSIITARPGKYRLDMESSKL